MNSDPDPEPPPCGVKVLAEDRDLPLYGSGGFRLMWDTKFDAGMCAFLDCLQQFKVGGSTGRRPPPPLV